MEPLLALTGFTLCLTTAVLLRNALFGQRLTRLVPKFITLVSIIFLVGSIGVPAYGTTITEYQLPGNPGPLEITMDSRNSSIFFTESAVDKIGRIPLNKDGTSGPLVEYSIPTPNCYVWGITNVSDYWKQFSVVFTERSSGKIGALAFNGRTVREWVIPTTGSTPHKIIFDRGRNCTWFTEFGTGKIGMMEFTASGGARFKEYAIPNPSSQPLGLAIDTVGPTPTNRSVWFTESAAGKIGRLWPETGVVVEYNVGGAPWDIAVDLDGMVWYTDTNQNFIGRLNPVNYVISKYEVVTFLIPTSDCQARGIAIDSRGNVWFTEFSELANKIGKYSPYYNTFVEYPILTPNARPHGLVLNQTNPLNVWFTELGSGKIGRLRQPEGPTTTTTVSTMTSAVTASYSTLVAAFPGTVPTGLATPIASVSTITSSTTSMSTRSSTITDTLSTMVTTTTEIVGTDTITTSSTWTTTTATNTQTATSTLTTSTTTTTTFTSVSTIPASVSTHLTSTSFIVSSFSTTITTTLTQTLTGTSFIQTVTVPTTTTAATATTTVTSPTITLTTSTTTTTTASSTQSATLTSTVFTPTITRTSTITTTTTLGGLGGLPGLPARPCIIASAAYGSELAPEVQELRDFRDKVALSTMGGSQFMAAFNSFYYSFSPAVARVVLSSSELAKVVRVILYPLIWSLRAASSVYASFSGMPELGILLAGLAAGALIGLVYLGPSLFVMRCISRRKHTR